MISPIEIRNWKKLKTLVGIYGKRGPFHDKSLEENDRNLNRFIILSHSNKTRI
jgi:hypothetical protein